LVVSITRVAAAKSTILEIRRRRDRLPGGELRARDICQGLCGTNRIAARGDAHGEEESDELHLSK
jgi:hypothetical protein